MVSDLAAEVPFLKAPRRRNTARPGPRPVTTPASPPDVESRPRDETAAARGKALLESHYELIQQKLRQLGRASGLPAHEAEELCSWALFKLVEDDYRVLARWEGRSTFSTYLTVVLVNLMRDYRIQVWGKWRPSAEARRSGSVAVLLERLWVRDGLSLTETIERMQTEHGVSLSTAELERMAAGLPRRTERRRVGEEELQRIAVDGQLEARLADRERTRTADRLRAELPALLRSLPTEERLLLRLHYRDGLSMAAIAPLLGRQQRELYSLRDRSLRALRRALEAAGLSPDRVGEVIGWTSDPRPTDGDLWE